MNSSLSPPSLAVYLCAGAFVCLGLGSVAQASTASYSVVHLQATYGMDLRYFSMHKDGTLTAYAPAGDGSLVGIINGVRHDIVGGGAGLPMNNQGISYHAGGDSYWRQEFDGTRTLLADGSPGSLNLQGQNRIGTGVGSASGLETVTGPFPSGGFSYDPVNGLQVVRALGGVDVIHFTAVNDTGYLVGYGLGSQIPRGHLYLWVPGQPALALVETNDGIAEAINEAAQVVGYAYGRAFFWDNGILTYPASYRVPNPGRPGVFNEAVTFSIAYDISENGLVVGGAEVRAVPGFIPPNRAQVLAWIWSEEQGFTLLNDLIDPALGYQLGSATRIADDGSILVRGYIPGTDEGQDFLLRPIPEPGMLGMLLLSVGIIYRRRR